MTAPLRAVVRPMKAADTQRVASLVATSFDPTLTPYMTVTQPGWQAFIHVVLSHPDLFPGHRLVVAELEGEVVGFADFRTKDRAGFLSYICVDPRIRRSGIARRLLAHVIQNSSDLDHVELDVFADNLAASELYRSLGFRTVTTNTWWRAPVGPSAPRRDLSIEQLPSGLATLHVYGFCEMHGCLDARQFRFGRIGERVTRFFEADDLLGSLPPAISAVFPEVDEMFAVLPGTKSPLPVAERLASANRMRSTDFRTMAGIEYANR